MFKLVLAICLLSASCAGYQLGGSKPTHLSHIRSIHVPLFENDTLFVRAETHGTNSMVDALTRDGTYKISTAESADAVLLGRITNLELQSGELNTNRQLTLGRTEPYCFY